MLTEELKNIFLNEKDPFKDILGQEKTKAQLKSALVTGRHVIIVGAPGIGKTTLAKNVAKLLPSIEVVKGCAFHCSPEKPICPKCLSNKRLEKTKLEGEKRFIRIQGSPDLTAEDLIGDIDPIKAMKYGPLNTEAFTPGKIFKANNGVLFFDELNRCPEKLQNSLLQILEEGKATIASYDIEFKADFIFIATMNPEDKSTEPLSDVLLDRFDVIYMSYPESLSIEKDIVKLKGKSFIEFPEKLLETVILFVRLLRENEKLEKLPSVRASIGLYERAQSTAFLKEKTKVDAADIVESIISVLSHRIKLKPSIKYLQNPAEFIKEEFDRFIEQHKELKGGLL